MIYASYISILTFVYTSVNKMLNTSYNFIYHRKCRTFVVGKQRRSWRRHLATSDTWI